MQDRTEVLSDIELELMRACEMHRGIGTPHEAIAVIREEYLEAEREVFAKTVDRSKLRRELTQLAAVCARTILDLDLDYES